MWTGAREPMSKGSNPRERAYASKEARFASRSAAIERRQSRCSRMESPSVRAMPTHIVVFPESGSSQAMPALAPVQSLHIAAMLFIARRD